MQEKTDINNWSLYCKDVQNTATIIRNTWLKLHISFLTKRMCYVMNITLQNTY